MFTIVFLLREKPMKKYITNPFYIIAFVFACSTGQLSAQTFEPPVIVHLSNPYSLIILGGVIMLFSLVFIRKKLNFSFFSVHQNYSEVSQ